MTQDQLDCEQDLLELFLSGPNKVKDPIQLAFDFERAIDISNIRNSVLEFCGNYAANGKGNYAKNRGELENGYRDKQRNRDKRKNPNEPKP